MGKIRQVGIILFLNIRNPLMTVIKVYQYFTFLNFLPINNHQYSLHSLLLSTEKQKNTGNIALMLMLYFFSL